MMTSTTASPRIAFIGAGRMATALAKGLIASGFARAEDIVASDVSEAARSEFAAATGAATTSANDRAAESRQIILLAVKPQQVAPVLQDLAGSIGLDQLIVSIAAGVRLQSLAAVLGEGFRLVRVMPNTPCLVGEGASAFAVGGAATAADAQVVRQMLETVGLAVQVPEEQLDAVTGLSGSGPAFVFQIIEALSDGGVRAGLPRDVATQLAAQTLRGAASMVLESGEHPGRLKDAVTSPGGTTIAGVHALERGGLRAALMDAVWAATVRSQELGRS
jgi:pyrroline-5-carboxylate reductase